MAGGPATSTPPHPFGVKQIFRLLGWVLALAVAAVLAWLALSKLAVVSSAVQSLSAWAGSNLGWSALVFAVVIAGLTLWFARLKQFSLLGFPVTNPWPLFTDADRKLLESRGTQIATLETQLTAGQAEVKQLQEKLAQALQAGQARQRPAKPNRRTQELERRAAYVEEALQTSRQQKVAVEKLLEHGSEPDPTFQATLDLTVRWFANLFPRLVYRFDRSVGCTLFSYNAMTDTAREIAVGGQVIHAATPYLPRSGYGIAGRAIDTKQFVICNNSASDGSFISTSQFDPRAILALPIVVQDQVVGVVSLHSGATDVFSTTDAHILGVAVEYLAILLLVDRLRSRRPVAVP